MAWRGVLKVGPHPSEKQALLIRQEPGYTRPRAGRNLPRIAHPGHRLCRGSPARPSSPRDAPAAIADWRQSNLAWAECRNGVTAPYFGLGNVRVATCTESPCRRPRSRYPPVGSHQGGIDEEFPILLPDGGATPFLTDRVGTRYSGFHDTPSLIVAVSWLTSVQQATTPTRNVSTRPFGRVS